MSRTNRGIGELGDAHIRNALKAQFEELLDAAATERELNCDNPTNKPSVVYLAAKLMGNVLGEIAHITLEAEEDAPLATMYVLMQWLPAFSRQQDLQLWSELIDELLLMRNGDHPSLLVPQIRGSGQRDMKLTLMKLNALKWNAFLKGRSNLKAYEYQSEISVAFGASWETIRRWETSAVAEVIDKHLDDARNGVGEGLCYPDYEKNLWSDGSRYQMQAGFKAFSFEDFLKKIGKSSS